MTADKRQTGSDLDRILQDAFFGYLNNEKWLSEKEKAFLEEYCLVPERDEDISSVLLADGNKTSGRTSRNSGVSGVPDVSDCPSELISPPNSNRGVEKYQAVPETQLQRGGFDGGCEVGFGGCYIPAFDEVKSALDKAKGQAAETGERVQAVIGGYTVYVEPSGANIGLRYRWVFVSGGVRFYIHNNDKVDQPVRVKYCAEALIGQNFYAVHTVVLAFLRSLGFIIKEEKISRVDLQVLIDKDITEFIFPVLSGCSVARSEVDKVHRAGGRIETYTLGCSGRLQLCIYDKEKELRKEQVSNPVKYKMVLMECIGLDWFMSGRPITRVEFRLWRDVLSRLEINSVKDLQEREYSLVELLTSHWFRILNEKKVRGSENRQDVLPLWLEVQTLFKECFPGITDNKPVKYRERKAVSVDCQALVKQAVGCLAKAAALKYGRQADEMKSKPVFHRLLDGYISSMFAKVNEWVSKLEITKGVRFGKKSDDFIPVYWGLRNSGDLLSAGVRLRR